MLSLKSKLILSSNQMNCYLNYNNYNNYYKDDYVYTKYAILKNIFIFVTKFNSI